MAKLHSASLSCFLSLPKSLSSSAVIIRLGFLLSKKMGSIVRKLMMFDSFALITKQVCMLRCALQGKRSEIASFVLLFNYSKKSACESCIGLQTPKNSLLENRS